MWTQQLKVIKVSDRQFRKQNDTLAIEKETTLHHNGTPLHTFHHYPGKEKEMALGFLVATKKCTASDVTNITIREEGIVAEFTPSKTQKAPLPRDAKVPWQSIYQLTAYLQEKALLFKDTAVTESAALASDADLITFSEDLHQNNAIYKAVGERLKQTDTLSNDILLVSSKIDSLTMKAIMALGITIVVSRVAPTSTALQLAEEHNITVLGFARGKKFSVYSHPENVTLPS
jgi:FdhD protein